MMAKNSHTAADVFVATLVQEGVEYVFGVPGEENLAFLDSLRRSTIKFIPTRHEQSAGFMAATIGRLTGNPGVCLSTLGPGATNLVTSVAYAQLGAMPALFITGQKPIKSSKQGQFQIINTVEMMRPLTKFTKQLIDAKLIASTVQEAFKVAREERPGAVHLELPEDIASDPVDEAILPIAHLSPRRPVAEAKAISQAVSLIEQATHPLILIGAGANRKRVSKMLDLLVTKTKIPFFTTQMGKGVISERHPQYLGTAALSSTDYIHDLVKQADLIINIGHDIVEKPPFLMDQTQTQQVIHLNFSPAVLDLIYHPNLEVIGDIANAIWQIAEAITPQATWDFSLFTPVESLTEQKLATKNPHSPFSILRAIRSVLADDDILTLDNGMYKLWFARHYPTYLPNTLLLDNALATMGAGLPSALAAKLINPDKKVVAVCGDGGFMMNSQELETAGRLGLDLVVIVLNDNKYGMISWKQAHLNLPDFGLSFQNPDFVQYAAAYGVTGHRLNSDSSLTNLLTTAFKTGGIHLIEVAIDYQDNQYLGKNL